MFYVYVLKSLINSDLYIGFSENLKQRFQEHNSKKVKSTKAYAPWELIYYEAYKDKRDATRREKQLKQHRPKLDLRSQIKFSFR